ncbi:cytochrome P450 [Actinoallomurus purpureus]|uniref:cytochrome P450 n=1 Tax=Actinoallomurus purpureus TaxID=478114 RepID=UPI0020921F0B|nr:cytochrome P450 [Actinoallomurus purpureus]MCO6003581.1 cytochrome P450 [Actinoallomurus purpureus]
MGEFAESITIDQLNNDPYLIYARLREVEPVAYVPALDQWMVTRNQDVRTVISLSETFISYFSKSLILKVCGEGNMLATDGDPHSDLRGCTDDDYARETLSAGLRDHVRMLANKYADELERSGSPADLREQYFAPVAVLSEAHILGLDHIDPEVFIRWADGMNSAITNFEKDPARTWLGEETRADIDRVLIPYLEELKKNPIHSTLSNLLHSGRHAGRPRPIQEILPTVRLILTATEEPGNGASSTMLGLLDNPDQLEAVKADPSLLEHAAHEGLRWRPPVGALMRSAARDFELGGATIPAGAGVAAIAASANRDERVYENPDAFDIHRPMQPHASLGYGSHRCLAWEQVPEIIRISIEVLLERFPTIRLDTDKPPVRYYGWRYRGPSGLPVRW